MTFTFEGSMHAIDYIYMCTKFDTDSSSRFYFRARTHTQTHKYTKSQTVQITIATYRLRLSGVCNNEIADHGSYDGQFYSETVRERVSQ